jgi:ketosteroid isomerase-like protein
MPWNQDHEQIADLDIRYQAAVKANDASTMDMILADDFVLITGTGRTFSKTDLLSEARSGRIHYTRQDASDRTVRVWGDTAVVTACLSAAGVSGGKKFDYEVWYSDTYVRNGSGWKYVLGQASSRLPTDTDGQ